MIIALAAAALALAQQAPDREPQQVEYRIEARLDESSDVLTGRARVRYTNNAPVALDTLWFHQHLNAFRPNSAWARREMELGVDRFQELGPEDHAFERLSGVRLGGRSLTPVYPGAPDSTVVAIPLPEPLAPGESADLDLDWSARLSTLPRRQGRRDRHFDFAQWYPRIAAYTDEGWQVQPLLPQGEFFGEFASYDVTLEVAEDQVIGSTGVPVEGDPGWAASATAGSVPDLQRDFYPAEPAEALAMLGAAPQPGQKRVRWRAEDVHHFAWSIDPEYIYEAGSVPRPSGGEVAIHLLYWPGDQEWEQAAMERTIESLEWLQDTFGPYPWPQLTNLHRIESGGTEFPMVIMNGSASLGLIMHETAHQYVHGIFANNEFAEGWLDEGFSSYLTNSFMEDRGESDVWRSSIEGIQQLEQRGLAEPISLPGAEFSDPQIYSAMTYTKAALVLRMLEWLIGDYVMTDVLREYYEQYALSHVDELDFVAMAETVADDDLGWFFYQWMHGTSQLDYGIASARAEQRDGRWVTTVEVTRQGDAWMPVTLEVAGSQLRLSNLMERQIVMIPSATRPTRAVLDPGDHLIDIDPTNDSMAVVVE